MQELRFWTDCGRRRGILIYRRFGARGLPVADECSSHHETKCAHCVWPLPSVRTKFHLQNRIFLEPAGCAPLRRQFNSNIQYDTQGVR